MAQDDVFEVLVLMEGVGHFEAQDQHGQVQNGVDQL
jgi:hypothetical protein